MLLQISVKLIKMRYKVIIKKGCQKPGNPKLNNHNILLYHDPFGENEFIVCIGYFNHVHTFCKSSVEWNGFYLSLSVNCNHPVHNRFTGEISNGNVITTGRLPIK